MSGAYVINLDPTTGSIWWRNKQRRGRPTDYVAEARERDSVAQNAVEKVWKEWTLGDVRAVCLLVHHGFVIGPVVLEGPVGGDVV